MSPWWWCCVHASSLLFVPSYTTPLEQYYCCTFPSFFFFGPSLGAQEERERERGKGRGGGVWWMGETSKPCASDGVLRLNTHGCVFSGARRTAPCRALGIPVVLCM